MSAWNFTPVEIPPGAVIVVPRDPAPFDFLATTQSIGSILGQIALAAASIATLSNH